MRIFITLTIVLLMFGCAMPKQISGSHVLIEEGSPSTETSPKGVKIFLEKPGYEYRVIALVAASTTITGYSKVAEVESSLLSELRTQAAMVGANGVVDVVREILVGETLISNTEWGTVTKNGRTSEVDPKIIQSLHDQHGRVSQGYLLVYRAKAIRHDAR